MNHKYIQILRLAETALPKTCKDCLYEELHDNLLIYRGNWFFFFD